MRNHYNRTALLEALGAFALAAAVAALVLTGRSRLWVAPRSDLLLLASSAVLVFWGAVRLRSVGKWGRRLSMRSFLLLIVPAALFFLPVRGITPTGLFAENAMTGSGDPALGGAMAPKLADSAAGSSGASGASDATGASDASDDGVSVREVDSAEVTRLMQEAKRKDAERKLKEQEEAANRLKNLQPDEVAVSMPGGTLIILKGIDRENKTITVGDTEYYPWLNYIFEHAEELVGYRVTVVAWAYRSEKMGDKFMLARYLITCCIADALPAGILATGLEPPEDGTWVKAVGTIEMTEFDGKKQPQLVLETAEPTAEPKGAYIYYNSYQ